MAPKTLEKSKSVQSSVTWNFGNPNYVFQIAEGCKWILNDGHVG